MSLAPPRLQLKLARYPHSLVATLATLPSMSLIPSAPVETHSLPSLARRYPRDFTFYAWHAVALAKVGRRSHCSIRMSPLLIKISKDFATIWTTIDQALAA
jgi:hypothetical protein